MHFLLPFKGVESAKSRWSELGTKRHHLVLQILQNPAGVIFFAEGEAARGAQPLRGARAADVIGSEIAARTLLVDQADAPALRVDLQQRPKAEDYPGYAYVVLHMVTNRSVNSREQLSLIFGRDFVITVQERTDDCLDPVRERMRRGKPRIRAARGDYLAYAIMDAVVDAYFPVVERLGERLEEIEDVVTFNPEPEDIDALHELKRDLVTLKRSLWPTRDVMNELRNEGNDIIEQDTRRYLRDVHDHVLQLIDIIETCREIATGLHDLYLSSMSNRMNEVMKVLTVIATIFIPLSFLAGLWGMNFDHMPELDWAWGYPMALGLMAAVAFGLLAWFRWKKWL
mgnify:CR=1 FL=1